MINKWTKIFCLSLIMGALAGSLASAETYTLDPAHSSIEFSVKHLLVSDTKGGFDNYQGSINFDPAQLETANVDVTIQTESIDTNHADRDNHLRSADFFDAQNFPTITFKSKNLSSQGDQYLLVGDLTIRGVTKEIRVPVSVFGPVKSPMGFDAIGLAGEFTIDRQDFGITWNKQMDQGGVVVGNDVKISVSLEAHKKS